MEAKWVEALRYKM